MKGMIPDKAFLRYRDVKLWPIEVTKVGNDSMFFEDGWKKFLQDNLVELGDFLVFQYNGNGVFDFKLFGSNACEKEVKRDFHFRVKDEEVEREEEEDESLKDKEEEHDEEADESIKDKEKEQQEEPISRGSNSSGKAHVMVAGENKRTAVVEVEDDFIFETGQYVRPKNPYFVTRMKLNTRKNVLLVPSYVIRDNNLKLPSEIMLRDEAGKTWQVTVLVWSDKRTWLSGWKAFCKWHNLQENDRCICEFLQGSAGSSTFLQIQVVREGSWLPK